MTEQRRSTDQPASKRASRTVKTAAALAALAVATAFAAAGFALYLNAGRTQQIQDERAANILRACREQNDRHDATISALDRLLARAPKGTKSEQVKRASTILLIDALAPKRDCVALVHLQVNTQ